MKTIKNMFLANFEKIENFRLFDSDTPIYDFEVKKSKKFFVFTKADFAYSMHFSHIYIDLNTIYVETRKASKFVNKKYM